MCWEDIKTGRKLTYDFKLVSADTSTTYQKVWGRDSRRIGLAININGAFSTNAGTYACLVALVNSQPITLAAISQYDPSKIVSVMDIGQLIEEEIGYLGISVQSKTFSMLQILTTQELENDHQ
jgi:hypothetical protein